MLAVRTAFLAALVFALSACANIRIHRTSFNPPRQGHFRGTYSEALWGLQPISDPVSLNKVCPSGWENISTGVSTMQGILHAVTLNLYSPWAYDVDCTEPPPPTKQEDEDD